MSTRTPLPHLDDDLPLEAFADDLLARLEAANAPAAVRPRHESRLSPAGSGRNV